MESYMPRLLPICLAPIWLAPLALVLGCMGCDSGMTEMPDLAVAPVPATTFQQINDNILQPSCANFTVCHSPEGKSMANKLSMKGTIDDAYNALFNKPAVNTLAQTQGLLLVKPCDPDNSFLLKKLLLPESATDPNIGYGEHMPKGNPTLPQAELDGIKAWIARGAHEHEPTSVTGSTCTVEDMGTAHD
jgi:hypothetical protein